MCISVGVDDETEYVAESAEDIEISEVGSWPSFPSSPVDKYNNGHFPTSIYRTFSLLNQGKYAEESP
jgi:hypothetical protein